MLAILNRSTGFRSAGILKQAETTKRMLNRAIAQKAAPRCVRATGPSVGLSQNIGIMPRRLAARAKWIIAMQFPEFDFRATSHVQFTSDDTGLDDGIISITWNAGTLHVQYVGLQEVAKSAIDSISETMWQFATECQLMLVLYAGVLSSRETIQEQLRGSIDHDTPFTVSGRYKGGNAILTLPRY